MKNFILILTGFILGIILIAVIMFVFFPSMMIETSESSLGYEETIAAIDNNTIDHGWAVLKVWDMKRRMDNAGYEESPRVSIIELCQADYTHRILQEENDRFISSIMPYRIAIYENSDGKVYISRMNLGLMSKFFSSNVKEVMGEAVIDNKNILKEILN
ncbi:MAG: DUF302 domain-containing protein [Candidatus Delongbacteria bacterium]|jgi:uncharacterized protein (DUF302 family)|nr:DUF302 domain-containing protein [Candidatus Delongbacteria bacterium]MDD4204636.1 DUF302 domain-containing protein [Candidatus Delongbacteria bacterium]